MPRKKRVTANKSTQKKAGQQTLTCPWCPTWYVRAIRPAESPPNKLFSRRSSDESNGVFDFDNVVEDENVELCFAAEPDSDDDSYYSDCGYEREESRQANLLNEDVDADDDDSDMSFIPSEGDEYDGDELDEYDMDGEDDDDDEDVDNTPYFTPKQVDDDNVPFCQNTFPPMTNFNPPSSFTMQLQLNHLFNRNKGSLKMYDETIEIIQHYIDCLGIHGATTKLVSRQAFQDRVENIFNTAELKPTYGSIRLHTIPLQPFQYLI